MVIAHDSQVMLNRLITNVTSVVVTTASAGDPTPSSDFPKANEGINNYPSLAPPRQVKICFPSRRSASEIIISFPGSLPDRGPEKLIKGFPVPSRIGVQKINNRGGGLF